MDIDETPLSRVAEIPRDVAKKLEGRWITSVEQLVALGRSESGVGQLSQELGLTEAETRTLLDAARRVLDPATVARLERPVDTSRYPLGARRPLGAPKRED